MDQIERKTEAVFHDDPTLAETLAGNDIKETLECIFESNNLLYLSVTLCELD